MCLYIDIDAVESVADEDIVVFKVVRRAETEDIESGFVERHYTSPYQGMRYCIGNTYESEFELHQEVLEGNELYGAMKDLRNAPTALGSYVLGRIEQGLHTFASYNSATEFIQYRNGKFTNTQYAILRCVIPAGSKYYKGVWVYGLFAMYDVASYASSALRVIDEYLEIAP